MISRGVMAVMVAIGCVSLLNAQSRMDLLEDDTVLEVGTRLSYQVVEEREPVETIIVSEQGQVRVPLIGNVPAKGKTPRALAFAIKERLEGEFFHPGKATVLVAIQRTSGVRGTVSVAGAVGLQGEVPLPANQTYTVWQAIVRSRGLRQDADSSRVRVLRADPDTGEQQEFVVNIEQMMNEGTFDEDIDLRDGDLIIVPNFDRESGEVYVFGAVGSPGPQRITGSDRLLVSDAILRAGGFTQFAKDKQVEVIRANPDLPPEERKQVVDVRRILDENRRDLDIQLEPGDTVRVREKLIDLGFN